MRKKICQEEKNWTYLYSLLLQLNICLLAALFGTEFLLSIATDSFFSPKLQSNVSEPALNHTF